MRLHKLIRRPQKLEKKKREGAVLLDAGSNVSNPLHN